MHREVSSRPPHAVVCRVRPNSIRNRSMAHRLNGRKNEDRQEAFGEAAEYQVR